MLTVVAVFSQLVRRSGLFRWMLVLLVVGAAILQTSGSLMATQNIVFIVADDAGYADFGFMDALTGGNTEFKTPNLDQLAAESVVMRQGYVTDAACSTSRAGFMTGRYAQRFGFEQQLAFNTTSPFNGMPTDQVLMTEKFKQLGYTTAAIGKWHLGASLAQQPQNQGVDHFFGMWSGATISYFGNEPDPLNQVRRGASVVNWEAETSFNGIAPDPTLGRHLTDAFADEAAEFISNNAGATQPFFLYMPVTAPHSPYHEAKASDLAEFNSTSLTGERKNVAALTYALDRAVGAVVDQLKDPNGDGDQSDSVYDNTVIAFINDNGGRGEIFQQGFPSQWHDNGPLLGVKGTHFEGGNRVPFMMRVPGIAPTVFDEQVSTLDLFPTFVAAAGGSMSTPTDGVNLLPHLDGTTSGPVHDYLFWRGGHSRFAVTDGEWKLAKGSFGDIELYQLNPDGSGETSGDLRAINPAKFEELKRAYVDWEVTLDKPSQADYPEYNRFNTFVLRPEVRPNNLNFAMTDAWYNADNPSEITTMNTWDSSANLILELHPYAPQNYTAKNNLGRSSTPYPALRAFPGNPANAGFEETMLNELRLTGSYEGTANRSAAISRLPFMFVNSLAGDPAKISLTGTSSTPERFTFKIGNDIVLYDDLQIVGDSQMNHVIEGQIRDFFDPRSITKSGTSKVSLRGHNTYGGITHILAGEVALDDPSAALDGTAAVIIENGATLTLSDGLIRTPMLQIFAGGSFDFVDGRLETGLVDGDLELSNGVFEAAAASAATMVTGEYRQTGGTLELGLTGTSLAAQSDSLQVGGPAFLGGNLTVVSDVEAGAGLSLAQQFTLVSSSTPLTGTFASATLPQTLGDWLVDWDLQYSTFEVTLDLLSAKHVADFDDDGNVDGDDLTILFANYGTSGPQSLGDASLDGQINGADYLIWQRGYQAAAATLSVPEPATLAICSIALVACTMLRRPF